MGAPAIPIAALRRNLLSPGCDPGREVGCQEKPERRPRAIPV
jgi:hypothetical protein